MQVNLTRRVSLLAFAGAGLALAAPGVALAQARGLPANVERDRQSILAMASDYRVRFNFDETVPFVSDYTPREPTTSGGYESVRVIEDRGEFISLQHLLVAEHEGQTFIIKHWRQDWTYQPRTVLVYDRLNYWSLANVSSADRRGAWSQTVWQTDDSPRYGGVGSWNYDNNRTIWISGATARPLARRDAIRNPQSALQPLPTLQQLRWFPLFGARQRGCRSVWRAPCSGSQRQCVASHPLRGEAIGHR